MDNINELIWVVDDDEAILEVFQIILQEAGYRVETIQDGRLVEEKVKKEKPVLVFLDLLMSGMNGTEVCQMLKNNHTTKSIPVIITSADTHIEEIAKQACADTFLKKPFDIDEAVRLTKQYLKK